MATLTVTSKGQVTLKKDLLKHLGVEPGEKVVLVKLPGGRAVIKAARFTGTIDNFIGLLEGKTEKVATLEEIDEATASAWGRKE